MEILIIILAALIPPFLWSLQYHNDDTLLNYSNEGEYTPGALLIFSAIFSGSIFFIVAPFVWDEGINLLNTNSNEVYLLIASGIIYTAWVGFYLFALRGESVLRAIPYFQFTPLFMLGADYIFYHELPAFGEILGSLLLVVGGMFMTFDPKNMHFRLKTAFLMITAAMFFALSGSLFDHATRVANHGYFPSLFWYYLGSLGTGLFLLIFISRFRKQLFGMFKNKRTRNKVFLFSSLNETFEGAAHLFLFLALLLGQNTVVSAISTAAQPITLLIVGIGLSTIFKRATRKKLTTREKKYVTVSSVLLVVGLVVLIISDPVASKEIMELLAN